MEKTHQNFSMIADMTERQAMLVAAGLGWFFLYLPLYIDLAGGAWLRDENGHAPFLLAIAGILAVLKLKPFSDRTSLHLPANAEAIAGFAVTAFGLLMYCLGRVEQIELISTASQVVVAAGMFLLIGGRDLLLKSWFVLFLLAYTIVWPGWALDLLTSPLKEGISRTVSQLLGAAGMPVAHAGVNLAVGPYDLLIADACSGLNSLIALTAVGAIYLYIVRYNSVMRNFVIILSLVPIAIFANFVRVTVLVLITYYWGYDAGQGFLHQLAGMLLFAVALACVFAIDSLFDVRGKS